ncbi:MAG: FkbM family methyltransferase, partial [Cyanobacteria bacterium J06648_11]
IAVDRFKVFEIELHKFRQTLEIPDGAVVFWTAAIGYKRNPECIERQLEIIKAVPDSVLVVKGLSDMPTVMNSFEEAAKEKGIEKQLRILALTTREESHRAQLGLVDVILDTFPYSGATHSMEALWRGVPILTQVGDHYYSRMTYSILENIGEFDACIARSGAEYVEKGIELGRNAALRARLRQRLHDTRKTSVVWDAWRLARSLEAAYHHVFAGGSVEGYVAHPEDLPDLTFSSAREWNQAGVDLFRQGCRAANVRERRSFWEKALEVWRKGAIHNPNSLPCAFNRIFLRELLGDLEYSLREAATLLADMETDRYEGECISSQVEEELIWLPKSLGSDVRLSSDSLALYVLTRWLAEHSGVLYRQEVLRFWQLAIDLCPEDIEARMVVGLTQLHQGNIGGIEHIDYVLARNPDFVRASTARSLARYAQIERDPRGWVEPEYIQGFQASV